jgi:hypothetical protein
VLETAKLAGFFAAHGIWCVSEGEPLIPLVGYELKDGERHMLRFAADALEQAVGQGKAWLDGNPESALRAAFVHDGYVAVESRQVDALLIDARLFGPAAVSLFIAVPYRAAEHPGGFAVHRPKFLGFSGPAEQLQALGAAFFEGVVKHDQGARVWNAHSDESL